MCNTSYYCVFEQAVLTVHKRSVTSSLHFFKLSVSCLTNFIVFIDIIVYLSQCWTVINYIYSWAVLKHKFEVFVLYMSHKLLKYITAPPNVNLTWFNFNICSNDISYIINISVNHYFTAILYIKLIILIKCHCNT